MRDISLDYLLPYEVASHQDTLLRIATGTLQRTAENLSPFEYLEYFRCLLNSYYVNLLIMGR